MSEVGTHYPLRDTGVAVIEPAARPWYDRLTLPSAITIASEMIDEWDYEKDAHGYCHVGLSCCGWSKLRRNWSPLMAEQSATVEELRRHHWYQLAVDLKQVKDFKALIEAERRDAVEEYETSRPLLDREAVRSLFRGPNGPNACGYWLENLMDDHEQEAATDAVMGLARSMPTREQVMSAMIRHIYEDPEPLARQGMPQQEWTLLSLAADAVVALLDQPIPEVT